MRITIEKIAKPANNEASGFQKFLTLFLIGFFIILVGIIILVIAAVLSGGSANLGAIVFIEPFPIVVGTGPQATWMILFAIILAVLSIIIFLISHKEAKTSHKQACTHFTQHPQQKTHIWIQIEGLETVAHAHKRKLIFSSPFPLYHRTHTEISKPTQQMLRP